MTPTIPAVSPIPSPDAPYLRAPRIPSDLSAPIATWDRASLRCTVTEGQVRSTWTGTAIFRDMRPGPSGFELTGVECESVTPEGEPSEAAEEAAWECLAGYADEIGGAK